MAMKQFAVCVDNADYGAALELRKIYQVLPDAAAASRSFIRVIDESGEDYLYPKKMFLRVRIMPERRDELFKIMSFERKSAKASKNSHDKGSSGVRRAKRTTSRTRVKATQSK
jgi:hypothetical protein